MKCSGCATEHAASAHPENERTDDPTGQPTIMDGNRMVMQCRLFVRCQECGAKHVAEYNHEGDYDQGPIYAVVCTADHLTDFYTAEAVFEE
jgi:hypothetical protein